MDLGKGESFFFFGGGGSTQKRCKLSYDNNSTNGRTRARNDMPRYKTLYPGKKLWTQVKISYSCTKL
jgi:hypothetical protein